jgi:hypothetical protein
MLGGALAPLWDFDVIYLFILNNFFNQTISTKTKISLVQFVEV